MEEMKYKVKFHPDAVKDLEELDHRVKILVFKQINKLAAKPALGHDLGQKHGIDLSGYKKLYADKKRIRIIYKVIEEMVLIRIIAVGKREGMKVYKKAGERDR